MLAATGCCDLAAFLCGPDRTPWVPVSYATHGDALKTFMEAVRRDQVRVIWESLSPEFRERLGLPGAFEAAVGWERLKEQTPGAHMLGRADVSGPEPVPPCDGEHGEPGRVRYLLEVAGERISVELARFAYAGIRYAYRGTELPQDRYVESLTPLVELVPKPDYSTLVQLRISDLELPDGVTAEDIREVKAGHEWKVTDMRRLESP